MQNVPILGIVVRKVYKYLANNQIKRIAAHFSQFLAPIFASNDDLKKESFKVRHQVYCEELKFESVKINGLETDDFDAHSYHCLIQHKSTKNIAGTVRIVYSSNEDEVLPIEKYCQSAIGNEHLLPSNFPRNKICEVSRLAVPAEFRKRSADKFKGAATGSIDEQQYSESELRCFPFIAVGLYLAATSLVAKHGIEHCFVMMEPRLARSLRFVGIPFQQIGPVVEYHGQRAPYYVRPNAVFETLSPGFIQLFKNIDHILSKQILES